MNSNFRSRRGFLKPETLGKLFTTVTGGEWGAHAVPIETRAGMLCRIGVDSMATRFEILFEAIDLEHAPTAEKGLELVLDLESQMTVYREESEISRINREAARREVKVEERLFGLLDLSRRLWEESEGAFDITVHEILKVWGVYKGPTRVPSDTELREALAGRGFDNVVLNPEDRTIRFKHPKTALNLAAIGKGYALDRVSEFLLENGMDHFLLHGGQSSLRAKGATTWEEGWLVNLLHPLDYSTPIANIRLRNQSMSTSVLIPERIREGPVSGHIIDPRNGRPVEGRLLSVSVLGESAAKVEALSTALLVMGLDKAMEYCEKHPRLGAIFTLDLGDEKGIEVRTAGIAEDCVEVLS